MFLPVIIILQVVPKISYMELAALFLVSLIILVIKIMAILVQHLLQFSLVALG